MELTSATEIKRPLQATLCNHVIPQLLGQTGCSPQTMAFTPAQCEALGQACLSQDAGEAERFARRFLAQGLAIESLLIGAIPAAARLFHDWWAEDRIDFVDVTRATFRLETLVYAFSAEFVLNGPAKHVANGLKALLVNTPGSHHSLGLLLLSLYFRRHGWQVLNDGGKREQAMRTTVSSEWVDLLGISVSDQRQFDNLTQLIRRLRQETRNPAMQIMVGGPALRFEPRLAEILGADLSTSHADEAHVQALALVRRVQPMAQPEHA
ncbi:MAG: hypothetical protein EBZ60_05600 [Betaproteobacteria bacterium]|nr:hypothetical protein [Betaproteobacteria bacterium]